MFALLQKARALNTHGVCWSGIVTGAISLAVIGAHQAMDDFAVAHLGLARGVARALFDGAYLVSYTLVWPAIVAAALGRPPTIPK